MEAWRAAVHGVTKSQTQVIDWTTANKQPRGLSSRQSDSVKVLKVLVTQSCMTFSNRMDYSPPGSSVYGILQATILEWGAISFSRGSSQHRDRTQVSCIIGRYVTIWAKWFKALLKPGSSVTWEWFSCKEQEMQYHLTLKGMSWLLSTGLI